MNGALCMQQQALIDALFMAREADAFALAADGAGLAPSPQLRRGLQAYRANGHVLAQRALAAAYPVVAALLGEENFGALARELWLADPPARGDIAQWGAALASFIEQLPDLRSAEPYLADVARVEWQLHRAATQADATTDPASFRLLAERDPAQLALRLAPGTGCIASAYPVASIVLAHGTVHEGDAVTLEMAGERLRAGVAETALVWRAGLRPDVRLAQPGEHEFIAELQDGRSLADSLQAAPGLDFGPWLALAVQEQLLLGAVPL
jgi:hypothetical protein